MKIISKRKAPEGYLAKFLPREIAALRRIRHAHIVLPTCRPGIGWLPIHRSPPGARVQTELHQLIEKLLAAG